MGNHSTAKCFYNTENPAKKRRPTQSAPQFGKSHFSNENSQFSKHESANITALDDIPQTDQHINDDSSSVGSFDADDIELSHDETTLLGMLDPWKQGPATVNSNNTNLENPVNKIGHLNNKLNEQIKLYSSIIHSLAGESTPIEYKHINLIMVVYMQIYTYTGWARGHGAKHWMQHLQRAIAKQPQVATES